MKEAPEKETSAFVGIVFGNQVIYNVLEREGEFEFTGLSIVHFLRTDKNAFAARIVESQNYESIKIIVDDAIVYGERSLHINTNMDSFSNIFNHMHKDDAVQHYYIYDIVKDVLFVKTPEMHRVQAIDYGTSFDVRKFINKLKS